MKKMSLRFYLIMVILIILASLFWIYFAITPNKKKRDIYFVMLSVLLAFTLVFYIKPNLLKATTTSSSTSSSSTTQSSTVKLTIESNDSFETDSKGTATITGQTTPKAQIQITANAMKNPAIADDKGNFSITYTTTDTEQKKIQITATLKSQSVSKEITIIPSQTFISTQQSATKTSSTQSSSSSSSN